MQRVVAAMGVTAMTLAGCSSDEPDASSTPTTIETEPVAATETPEPAAVGQVAVTATDDGAGTYAFEAPGTQAAGAAEISLTNTGTEAHHAQMFKLNDGVTMDELGPALASEDFEQIFAAGFMAGGTGVVDPFGGTSSANAVIDLTPGTWAFLCFIPGADGVPHLASGMVGVMQVTEAEVTAEVPAADATINGVDFGFELDELPANGVVELRNSSEAQLHEANLIKLGEGATEADVTGFFDGSVTFEGPPPFSSVGGQQAIMPGASASFRTSLEPGDYVLICLIPDSTDGVPHFAKGMFRTVTVA